MKPPVFEYVCVESVEEALDVLTEHGDEAKILAGGQSLVPMLNFRIAAPSVLVDINRVKELDYIRIEDGWVRIGAGTRQRSVEKSPVVQEKCPLLTEAITWVGHPQIRNRGTVGGSLVHGDPTAELALVATLLGGQLVIRGRGKSRISTPEDFFEGFMSTRVDANEMLTEVSFPVAPARSSYGFRELCLRHGDFAVVVAAVRLTVDESGACADARVAVGGGGPTPLRIGAAEDVLVGDKGSADAMAAAAARVPEAVQVIGDLKGSEAYRREMARVFVHRAIEDAWSAVKEIGR